MTDAQRTWTREDLVDLALEATGMPKMRWDALLEAMKSDAEMNRIMKAEWLAVPRDTEEAIRAYYRKSDIWFVNTFCHGVGALLKMANREPAEWQEWHHRFAGAVGVRRDILDYGGGFFNDTWPFVNAGYRVTQAEVEGPVTRFLASFIEMTKIPNAKVRPVNSQEPLLEYYAGVTCFETLEHVLKPVQLAKHLVTHLLPAGAFAMSVSFGAPEHAPYHVASNAPLSDQAVWFNHLEDMGLRITWSAEDRHRQIWMNLPFNPKEKA